MTLVTVVLIALLSAVGVVPQAGQQRFDSAVLSSAANTGQSSVRILPNGELLATSATLRDLILFAHRREPFERLELLGGPDWATTDTFDLKAVVASGHEYDADGSPVRTLSLLRAFLAETFQLKIRVEERSRAVYALTLATPNGTLGRKVRASDVDCGAVMRGEWPAPAPGQGPPCSVKTPPGRLFASSLSMRTIANLLSAHLDRPVIDDTGLSGRFDIEVEALEIKAPSNYKPGPSDLALPPAPGTSIFIAVREQLGLTLEPRDAPVPVLVLEHAERPRSMPAAAASASGR